MRFHVPRYLLDWLLHQQLDYGRRKDMESGNRLGRPLILPFMSPNPDRLYKDNCSSIGGKTLDN